jgi:hypothetical protein
MKQTNHGAGLRNQIVGGLEIAKPGDRLRDAAVSISPLLSHGGCLGGVQDLAGIKTALQLYDKLVIPSDHVGSAILCLVRRLGRIHVEAILDGNSENSESLAEQWLRRTLDYQDVSA